jgi:4-hydroxy-tetrahydrodipicolinate synthase
VVVELKEKKMTNKEYWKGIIPAMVTPLNPDETLDRDSLEKIINHLINSGCTGIFAAGSTGEYTNLRKTVYLDLVKLTITLVNGRIPVCIGVIEAGTSKCIEMIKELEQLGVDFVSCTANFYAKPERQENIISHYEKIAKAVKAKMMVYNNIDTTSVNILASTFREIAEIDNVIALKDTRPDWENHIKNLAYLRDKDISLVNGGEYLIGASFLMGSQANIAAASNIFPRLFVALYKAALAKDIPLTVDLSDKIALLNDVTRTGCGWLHGIKYVCEKFGLCRDIVAGNSTPLSPEARRQVDAIVDILSEYR